PNGLPVVTAANPNVSIRRGQSISASSLFSVADPSGDAVTRYRFYDATAGGGDFTLNGAPPPQGSASILIRRADLANLSFVGGTSGVDQLWVQASDGTGFGGWAAWKMTNTNQAPVVSAANATINLGQSIPAASLINATDPDGNAIAQYRFYDAT